MSITLIDCDDYKLTSFAGGTAYLLSRRGWSVALQGEDADQLREEIAAFESAWPCASRVALAAYLWNTLGYGSAATPLETA
jgi:hypothetical protein